MKTLNAMKAFDFYATEKRRASDVMVYLAATSGISFLNAPVSIRVDW
jgi:hypothetical protein